MINLNSYIDNIQFSTNLQTICDLLVEGHEGRGLPQRGVISAWGERQITVLNYEGAVSIHKLAIKLLAAANECMQTQNFSIFDREQGLTIACILTHYDKQTLAMLPNTNWQSFISYYAKESFFLPNVKNICKEAEKKFLTFTRESFLSTFPGKKPNEFILRIQENEVLGGEINPLYIVNESMIRKVASENLSAGLKKDIQDLRKKEEMAKEIELLFGNIKNAGQTS